MSSLRYIGAILIIFGLVGGFELISTITKIKSINTITKDQIVILLGGTWIIIGSLAVAQ